MKYLLSAVYVLTALSFSNAYAHDASKEDRMHGAFEQADTNKDGKISYEEFRIAHEKRAEEMFKKIDTNGDGFIDEAERKSFHEKMCERHHEHHKGWKHKSNDEETNAN
jgi:Ca2+-binding EF-hand superfamily protein